MRLVTAVGARPNFMKIAPFIRALRDYASSPSPALRFEHVLVHTGQHYDDAMSDTFFRTLGIPHPDINLGVGSGSHAEQVGRTMIAFEKVLVERQPQWVIVVGDVNATCACSITAKKQRLKVAHIEAGLRSFDLSMPEEINRIVTDRLSDLLFTPDAIADENLRREGVPAARIRNVGNIMIDTLDANRAAAAALSVEGLLPPKLIPEQNVLESVASPGGLAGGYAVLTLHRPANVDQRDVLTDLVRFFLDELCLELPLIWTLHPRTRARLESFGLWRDLLDCPSVILVEPLDYLEMLRLNMDAAIMLTDSGGLQEECCVLGTPCLTLRPQTERPVTLEQHGGVSRLVGNQINRIRAGFKDLYRQPRRPHRPPLWDGHTSGRIVSALAEVSSGTD
ncbi:MAG: UDP-N-acetylglucosamine 2-epimerase (non-hydrolyzing) [Lentisphaerae bacterium]|nr:UDP-N-acetylglucosamine 2-epimerase (non-hydrolyzing) [Lentisphaerota bacterium]